MSLRTLVRPAVFGGALLALLAACAGHPPAKTSVPAPASAGAAPRVPEQVSNAAWDTDMRRFAAEDAQSPPPRGGVVFTGSSSIRLWETLAQDFPGVPVINRGFGGSELRDSTWYADRTIVPYAPRQILIYAGDNDIHSGRSPQQVRADFIAFVERVRRDLPQAKIAYISTKPSPSRAHLLPAQREANALVQAEARRLGVDYIDIFTPMLDARGQPDESLFVEDRLHMNAAGYAIWKRVIAPYLQ
ncbi:SGNH/GDSL hydrolase family protein [Pseudoxanthomonas sp.]|uniref:SGNH/GDSL hydrolase family protein n=1 Tax=Pseudoxanthomonas sp. TaxID=1871049 RepID=UPI002E0EA3B3|nr:SGNH/GDSL hydrolase family protein [Pseudoxanthomonas sp.]